ncbi:MAG: hypothetical protein IKP86_03870 [Anaerolineaceae bacterium]|nr:hypothetical protein [Anaerolineaceae bacterium]
MKNNEINVVAVIAALAVITGVFLPFVGIDINIPIIGSSGEGRAIDIKYGWIFIPIAVIGLISGLVDDGILEVISGVMVTALAYYGHWILMKDGVLEIYGWQAVTLRSGIGYYVLLGAGIGLVISSMFSSNTRN